MGGWVGGWVGAHGVCAHACPARRRSLHRPCPSHPTTPPTRARTPPPAPLPHPCPPTHTPLPHTPPRSYDAKNAADHLSGFNVQNRYLIGKLSALPAGVCLRARVCGARTFACLPACLPAWLGAHLPGTRQKQTRPPALTPPHPLLPTRSLLPTPATPPCIHPPTHPPTPHACTHPPTHPMHAVLFYNPAKHRQKKSLKEEEESLRRMQVGGREGGWWCVGGVWRRGVCAAAHGGARRS